MTSIEPSAPQMRTRRLKTSDLGDEAQVDSSHAAGPAVVGAEREFPSPVRAAAQADRRVVGVAQSRQN